MSFNPEFISDFWAIVGALAYAVILLVALRYAAWWRLRDQRDLNVLLIAIVCVLFIWSMQAGFNTSLKLHLIGATLLTLMFGYAFALIALSLVMVGMTVFQGGSFISLPWLGLLIGVLPISISYGLFRLADRYLPNNFFIYVFICAFFGAALSMLAVMMATTSMHYLSGEHTLDYLRNNYFQYSLLIMFPEAFITGMLMSIFVAFRPQWVSTFDDRRYLRRRDQRSEQE